MQSIGKCPKCDKIIGEIKANQIEAKTDNNKSFKGVIFTCPSCTVILSASIDPFAVADEIVNRIRHK